jgi:class 3 adenylate cyclase
LGAESYADALAEHRRVLREAFVRHRGVEVDTQGDAFFLRFPDGVWWVPLGSLRDPQLVLEQAGQALDSENGLAGHIADARCRSMRQSSTR